MISIWVPDIFDVGFEMLVKRVCFLGDSRSKYFIFFAKVDKYFLPLNVLCGLNKPIFFELVSVFYKVLHIDQLRVFEFSSLGEIRERASRN